MDKRKVSGALSPSTPALSAAALVMPLIGAGRKRRPAPRPGKNGRSIQARSSTSCSFSAARDAILPRITNAGDLAPAGAMI